MWSREELEAAFQHYIEVTQESALSGAWKPWAELFTEDVKFYVDNELVWQGRETLREGAIAFFASPPFDHMRHFLFDWYVIDETRGWVVFEIRQRMDDPGDGSIHEHPCIMRVVYGGNQQWSEEYDYYDPARMEVMGEGWIAAYQGSAGS